MDTVQVHRQKLGIVKFSVQRCSHLNVDPLKARAGRPQRKVNWARISRGGVSRGWFPFLVMWVYVCVWRIALRTEWLKITNGYYLSFCGSETWGRFGWCFGVSPEVPVESLTGWRSCPQGGSFTWPWAEASVLTRGHRRRVSSWWEDSLPPADDQTERFRWKPLPLLEPNCTRDVLSLPPCSVGHRDSHYYSVEGREKEHGGQEVRTSGGRLKLTYHPSWGPFLRRGEN